MNCTYVPFSKIFSWCKKSNIGSRQGGAEGKYKLYIASATETKRFDEYLDEGESLVFGTGGNPCVHYVDGKYAYTNHCESAKPISSEVYVKFFYYFFQRNRFAQLMTTFVGGGIKNSSKKKIGELLVPSIPLIEQERIVARIEELFSELDKAVETLQTTKQQLAVYRQAVLKEAFESFKRAKTSESSIDDICDYIVDCPHSTPKWVEKGKLCLRTTNFRKGFLDLSMPNYVSDSTFESRVARLRPLPGDVLYSREGAILGISCIIPKGLEVCLGQRMMVLRTGTDMNNKFLMHYLNSPYLNSVITENIGGSASPHINVGDIKKFLIPVPDINEQNQTVQIIESRLSVCESIEQTVEKALAQADAMRQSILKQAFGENT